MATDYPRNLPASAAVRALLDCRRCDRGSVVTTTGDGSHGTLEPEACPHCDGTSYRIPDSDPNRALEALIANADGGTSPPLWPWELGEVRWIVRPGDDTVEGDGHGYDPDTGITHGTHSESAFADFWLGWRRHSDLPELVRDLELVASLGVSQLLLVRSLASDLWPGRTIVWCPMPEHALVSHHIRHEPHTTAARRRRRGAPERQASERMPDDGRITAMIFPSRMFSYETASYKTQSRWPEECPLMGVWEAVAERWWPRLRCLYQMGVHPIGETKTHVGLAIPWPQT